MSVKLAAFTLGALALPLAPAAAEWRLEALTGTAHNFTTPLTLRQTGQPDFRMDAHYGTRPFTGAPYYSARVSWWKGSSGWEVQLLHHKLYLDNPSPEVSHLEISHGYNLVTVNRAWERWGLLLRGGAGFVYTFPETTVRGRKRPVLGYDFSGFTAAAAVGGRWPRASRVSLSGELRLTFTWADIPVFEGEADVPNRALHFLAGLGYRF